MNFLENIPERDLWSYLANSEKSVVMYGMGNGADKILAVCEKYGIEVIPTLLLFKDGKVVNKLIGYNTAEEIEKIF